MEKLFLCSKWSTGTESKKSHTAWFRRVCDFLDDRKVVHTGLFLSYKKRSAECALARNEDVVYTTALCARVSKANGEFALRNNFLSNTKV